MKEEGRMLTSAEAGRMLGVTDRTVKRWVEAGKLRGFRPGRAYQIPESAVEDLLEGSEIHRKERPPRSVKQQLEDDPGEDVNLLESWASEGRNTGGGQDSLLVILLKLDTDIQSAGDGRDDRLTFIDDRMSEEDSPTILKWLDTRREWVEREIYKPMHPMTAQAAARRVERLLKA